jgi:hypothetical protein
MKIKYIFHNIEMWFLKLKYPENVWYGGSLKRKTALGSVGKGWSKIINNLYDAKPKHTRVVQVKEKYGTLRFYTECSTDWYEDLINFYEYKSGDICEQCGEKGTVRSDLGWILTLCDKHYNEHNKR